jgi:hypothetical protein
MKRTWLVLLLVTISAGVASAQRERSQDAGACVSVDGTLSGITCPFPGCHETYSTLNTEACDGSNECDMLIPISTCCGKGGSYVVGGICLITEMKDPHVRTRILELARDTEILIPTCNGAYVPVRIAFGQARWMDNGGL